MRAELSLFVVADAAAEVGVLVAALVVVFVVVVVVVVVVVALMPPPTPTTPLKRFPQRAGAVAPVGQLQSRRGRPDIARTFRSVRPRHKQALGRPHRGRWL